MTAKPFGALVLIVSSGAMCLACYNFPACRPVTAFTYVKCIYLQHRQTLPQASLFSEGFASDAALT